MDIHIPSQYLLLKNPACNNYCQDIVYPIDAVSLENVTDTELWFEEQKEGHIQMRNRDAEVLNILLKTTLLVKGEVGA